MRADVAVIGGGFYGCCLAVYLRQRFAKVVLFEREPTLMMRASRVNQARLHNGYHYPRSFLTAARSHANLAVFRRHYPEGVEAGFRHLYGIARNDSKVGRRHFERLARTIGMSMRPAPDKLLRLFDPRLIAAVYEVEEPAFNIDALRETFSRKLAEANVDVRLGTDIRTVDVAGGGQPVVQTASGAVLTADWVFNCTYAGLNRVVAADPAGHPALAHQLAEVALIEPPDELRDLGITIMDGPFFSVMPFPSEQLHSLTHVRYTPHLKWTEAANPEHDPALIRGMATGGQSAGLSHFAWMVRDAMRYVPVLARARHVKSLYDVKTLVTGTQMDDARPILFHQDRRNSRIISILGGKIDNIFDVYEYVDSALDSP
jgi:glycine/D-amino acid oxidase-like deaminating enzyme